jgi:TonB family protein
MSARRLVCSCAVMALVLAGGGWYVTGVFPLMQPLSAQELLTEPGPLEREATPITPENPIPRRIFAAPAYYPAAGLASGARAAVRLRVTVDERGAVAEVRRLQVSVTAPTVTGEDLTTLQDQFAAAAGDAARRWVYEPPAEAPVAFDIGFDFAPTAAEATSAQGRPGERLSAGMAAGPAAGVPPSWPANAVRVGGAVREPTKIKHVAPVYPPLAEQARVTGLVILEAVIGEDGKVQNARVIRPAPLAVLDDAALTAVRQWEFTPTLLNGVPVPVVMTVTVNFTLAPPQAGTPSSRFSIGRVF